MLIPKLGHPFLENHVNKRLISINITGTTILRIQKICNTQDYNNDATVSTYEKGAYLKEWMETAKNASKLTYKFAWENSFKLPLFKKCGATMHLDSFHTNTFLNFSNL